MSCDRVQREITAALVGGLPHTQRLEIEAHAARCLRCAHALADLRATTIAVDRAYASLRGASVRLSPARVRLAAHAPIPTPLSVRLARVTTRINEIALAAAVTAFAFIGAGSVLPERTVIGDEQNTEVRPLTHVTTRLDDATFVRWIRLDRYVPPDDLIDPTAQIRIVPPPSGGGGGGGR